MNAITLPSSRAYNIVDHTYDVVVVGAGHADKNQISVMLKILLPKAEPKSADAADALALALAHRTRTEARVGLALSVVPALIGAGIIAFGILPPAYAPIASLLGGAMAVAHARRSTD